MERVGVMTRGHALVFCLTFIAYVGLHAERKSYTNVKSEILVEWGFSEQFLGALDTVFMLAYAVGLYASGVAGDATSPKTLMLSGLFASTIVVMLLGYGNLFKPIQPWFLILMIVNGLVQSMVWPNAVAIMAVWFAGPNRGFILGLWAVNANVGNLVGGIFNSISEGMGASIRTTLLIPCLFTTAAGIVVYFYLVQAPVPSTSLIRDNCIDDEEQQEFLASGEREKAGLGFLNSLRIPGVVEYALAYACIKNVNYSAMFWMSFYLNQELGYSESVSAQLSILFDVGSIVGGIIIGIFSDRIRVRCIPCVGSLLLASATLFMFSTIRRSVGLIIILLILNGIFINGPSALISAAISADLGRHKTLSKNKTALATVAGIIDGTGALGTSLGQYGVAALSAILNWSYVFYMMSFLCLLSCLLLMRLLISDIMSLRAAWGTPLRLELSADTLARQDS